MTRGAAEGRHRDDMTKEKTTAKKRKESKQKRENWKPK